ncbi:hypothetical protein ZJ57_004310 [Salmonella enterica subsp. enterica]|nr:hypothetical protein [Salmonella enterica subsp. enterica]
MMPVRAWKATHQRQNKIPVPESPKPSRLREVLFLYIPQNSARAPCQAIRVANLFPPKPAANPLSPVADAPDHSHDSLSFFAFLLTLKHNLSVEVVHCDAG